MLIGAIADDFTGASDIANTLAKGVKPEGGLLTAQYPGIPSASANPAIEAGVISLKSRSAPVEQAVSDSIAALNWLRDQGCRQFVFKYCSTFDSMPEGNIGPVAEALADELGASGVIVCPAFPGTGRTIYQGHLFVNDTLLSESGMQNHPLTPMTDPDIRRWLRLQTNSSVGHLPLASVLEGADAIKNAIKAANDRFIVADASVDEHLLSLGAALSDAKLITGGSGIALGLPRNFIPNTSGTRELANWEPVAGPEAILAGSCSGATRSQIEAHAKRFPCLPIDVPRVLSGEVTVGTLVEFFSQNGGEKPLVYSSGTPDDVRAIQEEYGAKRVADKLDSLFADTARELISRGYRRIVVAGGETSGAVAQSVARTLGSHAMIIGPEIDPGVPVLKLGRDRPVALALKSANFGALDFFSKALAVMETVR